MAESGGRITKAQRLAVEEWLGQVRPLLKLADWRMVLEDQSPDSEGATAAVNANFGTRSARVRLGDLFLSSMEDIMRTQVLLHELLHLHFEDAWQFAEKVFDTALSGEAGHMTEWAFRQKMEVPIDQLAYVLADFVPPFVLPQ